jgi:hypothetical protein
VIGNRTTGDEDEEGDEDHRIFISTFSLITSCPVSERRRIAETGRERFGEG